MIHINQANMNIADRSKSDQNILGNRSSYFIYYLKETKLSLC